MHGGQHRPGRVGEGVEEAGAAVLERLGRLGVHQSSLSPRIAGLLRVDAEEEEQAGQQPPPQMVEDEDTGSSDQEGLYGTYFQVEKGLQQDEEDGSSRGSQGVPLLNWGWWRKRRFLSVEDEERVARCAAQRERKSVTWVETYFHEFALAAHHVKRAALVLHRRLGCATTLQPPPPPSSNGHQPPPPLRQQEGCSRALLLPRLRWLRPCDPEWVDQLWLEVRRSPLVGSSMLVTYLEKALGDLLCWKTEGRQRVPCRINDLLGEPALQDLLGPDAVFVVRCLVGPPNGLNIRNLLWHGFLDPEQLHPALLDFLMVLVASLGSLLGEAQLMAFSAWGEALDGRQEQPFEAAAPADTLAAPSSSESTRRARKSRGGKGGTGSHLRRLEAMDRRFASDFSGWAPAEIFLPDSGGSSRSAFEETRRLFGRSHFVLPQRVAPWVEALQIWMGIEPPPPPPAAREEPVGLIREGEREEYRCLLVMLPQLEHSLRRVFVAVNEFAEERLLTAEAAVYYTTLDIMTAQRHDPEAYAEGENYVTGDAHGPLNRLPLELGQPMMHLLRDLNDWFAGPRLRIKVSHGLVARSSIPRATTDLIMVAAIALCARYDPCPAMQGPFVSRCVEYVEAYRPYYHPISILQRRTFTCLEAWGRHHRLSIAELGGPASADAPCDAEADESALRSLVSAVATHMETLYGHPPLFLSPDAGEAPRQLLPDDPHFGAFGLTKRVFCSRHEESVTALLTDIVGLVREILAEVSVRYYSLGKLVVERRAYHHQRRIFAKLRASLPYFGLLAQLVMLLVEETACRQDSLEQAAAAATHDCPAAATTAADAAAVVPPLPDQSEDQTTQKDDDEEEEEEEDASRLQAERKERARREKEAIEHSPTFTLARAVQDLLGRQLGCVRENEWDKAREILGCWLGDEERTYRLLSKRERFKFWAALPAHLPFPVPACGASASS